jgi:cytochrome c-type protein NapC
MRRYLWIFFLIIGSALLWLSLIPAEGESKIDWNKINAYPVKFFYPGVASWKFLNSPDHSIGAKAIVKVQKSCTECHVDKKTNEYDIMADKIVSGKLEMKKSMNPFEPRPVPGKPGFLDATIQAAYDEKNIYLRIQWNSTGASWKGLKGSDGEFADRVSVQLNSREKYFVKYGCFINCHNDLRGMPESPSAEAIKKHPYYSSFKRNDVRLYAFYTRNKEGWNNIISEGELDKLQKESALIDLWNINFKSGGLKAEDGWVLHDRREDKNDLESEGGWEGGKYTAVFKRKLRTGDPKDIELKEGDTVTISIAVHDDKANHRRHHVSFPVRLGLGAEGDIRAERVK